MASLSTGGAGGGDAYTYVQDAEPSNPEEGESWYDTGANAAYVYDGASWIKQTVVDHGELSGVGSSNHHTRPTETAQGSEAPRYYRDGSDNLKETTSLWIAEGSSDTWTTTYPDSIMSTRTKVNWSEGTSTLDYWELRDENGTVIDSASPGTRSTTFTVNHTEQRVAELYCEGTNGSSTNGDDDVSTTLTPEVKISPAHLHTV